MGMKYLKMFESFNDSEIHYICREYGIENYTINKDRSIDVDGNVDISGFDLEELPLSFGTVYGMFNCSSNNLESLKGSPKMVLNGFGCHDNQLTNLEYLPKDIGGAVLLSFNELTSLKGCPEKVNGVFKCDYNKLTSLEFCPKEVTSIFDCSINQIIDMGVIEKIEDNFYCKGNPIQKIYNLFNTQQSFIDSLDYDYFRGGNKINKIRLEQALAEFALKCPNNIPGYEFIQ